ncbi:uncharacterized protein L203_104394 [Cryptococcus depauperatus CBS 7841]|uniref:Uncharacterized protein n=1 Tax=Cryptococcus depauperatus CBS 7841 TaxID=1295531 RepID=A0A1E3IG24_9TREE|nr:hypothetical protein L203_03330 [Cryptococcus depauperatus CBS 7841]
MPSEMSIPRYDFYQTASELILALYVKGYDKVKDDVKIDIGNNSALIVLPAISPESQPSQITLSPLAGLLEAGSTYRILGTKIEFKLRKAGGLHWPGLLVDSSGSAGASQPLSMSTLTPNEVAAQEPLKAQQSASRERKNWDKIDIEEDEVDSSDPNAGGDAALQKFFSQLYSNSDDDTRRAMIKSFTESGGTTLSTDWSSIGKQTTPIRPPEGVEPKKF